MSRNETQTCRELIEPALRQAGWGFDRQLELGPGPVNLSGGNMYDDTQRLVVDYLLRIVLLLMATGTGKTFTVFQLIWKLMNGGVLKNNHVLFLTDRNNLQDQAWRAFSAFASDERVVIDKEVVRKGEHQFGKVFFANYQN